MRIPHPLLGLRPIHEFVYIGDASLMARPQDTDTFKDWHDYVYLRANPDTHHRELWYHNSGDQSYLVVERHMRTHEILKTWLARDYQLTTQV